MAKKGDKHTSPDGKTWVATEGGNWREYVNGKPTNNVSRGSTPPGGAAGPSVPGAVDAGASQKPTIQNNAPANLSPAGSQWLNLAWQNLQQQVASGQLSQEQALAQGQKNNAIIAGESPALQQERLNLQGLVNSGQMNYSDLENQMYNSKLAQNQTAPQTGTNITHDSPSSVVSNEMFDVAKAGATAGNVLSNPNQQNPFGSRQVTIDPVTGQPTITDTLSQANQGVLSGIQGSAQGASTNLQNLLGQGGAFNQFLNAAGPQSGYSDPALEQAVYGRLTSGFGDEKERGRQQAEQNLANRGIPVGSEAYSRTMKDFESGWNDRYDAARANATIQGTGTALQRQQNNIGSLQSLIGGMGTLSGIGQGGFYSPNFQGFNATPYQQFDVQSMFNSLLSGQISREQIASQEKQTQMQINAAKPMGGGGAAHQEEPTVNALGGRPPGS